jgi:hypothetical protein
MPLPIYVRDWNRIMVRAGGAKIKLCATRPGERRLGMPKKIAVVLEGVGFRLILELF